MKKLKISIREILLLILMLACFVASMIFLILDNSAFAIVTLALHCCLTIAFLLVYHEELAFQMSHSDEPIEYSQDVLSEYTDEIARLSSENNTLTEEKETLLQELEELRSNPEDICGESIFQEVAATDVRLKGLLLPEHEEPIQLDMIHACNSVIDEMRADCQKSGISIVLSTDCETLPVRADASFIRIMFRNIIDNSIKYMGRNGSLVITVSNIGEDIFIVLKDNGEGLSLTETEHIFELNYQGSNRVSGNGLGLTQAKAIVDYYGGIIYAKSGAGKGMAIYIQLPAESASL